MSHVTAAVRTSTQYQVTQEADMHLYEARFLSPSTFHRLDITGYQNCFIQSHYSMESHLEPLYSDKIRPKLTVFLQNICTYKVREITIPWNCI